MHSVAADNCFTLHVEMRYGIYPCLIASYAIQIHSELNMSVKFFFFLHDEIYLEQCLAASDDLERRRRKKEYIFISSCRLETRVLTLQGSSF